VFSENRLSAFPFQETFIDAVIAHFIQKHDYIVVRQTVELDQLILAYYFNGLSPLETMREIELQQKKLVKSWLGKVGAA
jgi:hypothetical protein